MTTQGPVLVLAGAGSGKTRALTARVAYLIEQGLARPEEVVAVTFTNKAAHEMKERIGALIGQANRVPAGVSTFHSLGAKLLRQQARYTSRTVGFTIFDTQDSERSVRKAMEELHISKQEFSPRAIRARVSQLKQQGLAPDEAAQQPALSRFEEAAAAVYGRYQTFLQGANAWDFDDLMVEPVRLLAAQADIRRAYQAAWRYLLVDEYQDTSPLQNQLLGLLLGPERNLCAVGDDYQAIYSWRGARVETILQFERDYPDCTTIYLTQNYRSSPQILAAAQTIIAQNSKQKHKQLWTHNQAGPSVQVITVASDRAEARYVRQTIEDQAGRGGRLKDCFVLYRTNAQSRAFEEEFLTAGVPYTIVGGFRFYERREIKDALALLTLWVAPNARLALERVAAALWRGVGPKTLGRWEKQREARQQTLLALIAEAARERPLFQPFARTYQAQARKFETVEALLKHVLAGTGYLTWLKTLPDGEERKENIEELLNVAAAFTDPSAFLEEVALLTDLDTVGAADDRVLCMTLHAAKGLEASLVFIVGLEDGLLPHQNSLNSTQELEEERRLLYVGMTRARARLMLLHAEQRYVHGQFIPQAPSRFLAALPEDTERVDLTDTHDDFLQVTGRGSPVESGADPVVISAEIGDFISHRQFGRGVVVSIQGSLVTCVFEERGVKTIDGAAIEQT